MNENDYYSHRDGGNEMEFEEEKEFLEKENIALKEELAKLVVFLDSSFLPLKPDSENEKTYSTEAVAPSSTLTLLSSSSSSYAPLPGQRKLVADDIKNLKQSPAESNAKRVALKSDFLQKYDELQLKERESGREEASVRSLSEGALSSEVFSNEQLSTTPQRFYEAGRHIEIGRLNRTRPGQSDGTIAQSLHLQTTETGSTISKKLNFEESSEEEFEEIRKSSAHDKAKFIFGRRDKNWETRVIGEIAFQLDRRILQHIFTHRRRLYGFTVRNISEKIEEIGANNTCGECDAESAKLSELRTRRDNLFKMLKAQAEFDTRYHPMFSELIVNKYGILKISPWEIKEELKALQDLDFLTKIVTENVEAEYRKDAVILLRSLNAMSAFDGKPILMW